MNKGFTLVEILGALIVFSILVSITAPLISGIIEDSHIKAYETQVKKVKLAAKNWGSDNLDYMPKNGESITIFIYNLKKEGFLKTEYKSQDKDKPLYNDIPIEITADKSGFKYRLVENYGSRSFDFSHNLPNIVVNGSLFEKVQLNTPYVEKGLFIIEEEGISSTYSTKYFLSGVEVPNITTNIAQTFTTEYTVNYGVNTYKIVRETTIGEFTPPTLVVPLNDMKIYDTEVASLDLSAGVFATDYLGNNVAVNREGSVSSTPGLYIINYIATDSLGNIATKKIIIEVMLSYGEWSFEVEVTAGSLNFGFATVNSDMIIEWGDGTKSNYNGTGYPTKTYATAGTKRITLKGTATKISFCTINDWNGCNVDATPAKLRDIVTVIPRSFGLTNASYMFSNTTVTSFSTLNFFDSASQNITNMAGMFYNAINFNHPIGNWNTSNVTSIRAMFQFATSFNQNINSWNISKVDNIEGTFYEANNYNQPLNNWNTSNVTTMTSLFNGADVFNQNINNWDTSKVTRMDYTFNNSVSFNQPLANWKTSLVTNMNSMFWNANTFNQNLSNWCVSNFASSPSEFSTATPAWTLPKPVWGTCP